LTDNDTPAADALKQVLIEQLSLKGAAEPLVSASQPRGMMLGMARQMMRQSPMMHRFGGLGPFAEFRELQVAIPLQGGQWLTFTTVLPESGAAFSLRFLVSMGMMAVITLLVAIWVVRRVTAPLTALSKAALRLGEDLNAAPMPEVGPVETQQAAHAFNAMQSRLRGMIEDRTKMLAAISHDFRTPLTLLRLRVENVDDPVEREKMLSTIADLDAMVAATLEFASGGAQQASRRPTDLTALIESMIDDLADGGLPVSMETAQPIIYECDPATLKRALTNLVDNAVKYGGGARVAIHEKSRAVERAGACCCDGVAMIPLGKHGGLGKDCRRSGALQHCGAAVRLVANEMYTPGGDQEDGAHRVVAVEEVFALLEGLGSHRLWPQAIDNALGHDSYHVRDAR
jgi:hypothetical protein